jgi:hypothetical protein
MRSRRARSTIGISGLVAALIVALPTASVVAFTITETGKYLLDDSNPPVSFCIDGSGSWFLDGYGAPSRVSVARAKGRLKDAIENWETAPGKNSAQAFNLAYHSTCQSSTDFRVQADVPNAIPSGVHGWAKVSEGVILMQDEDPWYDGIGTQASNEWSFEGVLTHEIGHVLGLGHAGHWAWTYDSSSQFPTMAEKGSELVSETFVSLQQDDWGGASWAAVTAAPYFSANSGFEKEFTHWYRSNIYQITPQSVAAYTGDLGAQLASSGNYIYMTSVYDPWIYEFPLGFVQVSGMDDSPLFTMRTHYRHASGSTTGGVEISWQREFLDYRERGTPKINKVDGYEKTHSLSMREAFPECPDQGTTWKLCAWSTSFGLSQNELDAAAIRPFFESTSTGHLYLDKAGVYEVGT